MPPLLLSILSPDLKIGTDAVPRSTIRSKKRDYLRIHGIFQLVVERFDPES